MINHCRQMISMIVAAALVSLWALIPYSYTSAQQCHNPDLPPTCDFFQSEYCSPIILDVAGNGFHLTSASDGVMFDISGTGRPLQISWTAPGEGNAFLALDRNHNGKIDSGRELFGNFTPQPASANPNGFLALADFDKPESGGNGDGVIDQRDVVFWSLRLWVDVNHDGISQPEELFTLPQLGVWSISLSYKESRRVDKFGNEFRYRSMINVTDQSLNESTAARTAYDIFLVPARGK